MTVSFHPRVTGGFDVTRPGTDGPEPLGNVWHRGDGSWLANDGRGQTVETDGGATFENRDAAARALVALADLRARLNASPVPHTEEEEFEEPPGPDVFERLDGAVDTLGWTDQRDQEAYNDALWGVVKVVKDLGTEVARLRREVATLTADREALFERNRRVLEEHMREGFTTPDH